MFKHAHLFASLLLIGFTSVHADEHSNIAVSPSLAQHVDIEGTSLYIECFGEKAPNIIVHSGFGGAGSDGGWESVIESISKTNRICFYDRANLGKSSRSKGHYDIQVIAKQLDVLLNKAQVKPPYVMVSHSYGSYSVRAYNHLYKDKISAVLLVDPTQYGMFYNGVAKWNPEEDTYSKDEIARMQAELAGFNDPNSNPERIYHKTSAEFIRNSDDFGATPLTLIWNKNGIWQGGDAPDTWHPKTWDRMKAMYAKAIDDMHTLSTKQTTRFANTEQHNIFFYEPSIVIEELKALLAKTKK